MASSGSSASGHGHGHGHGHGSKQDGASSSSAGGSRGPSQNVISRQALQMMVKDVDPNVQLDEETEDTLISFADEILEQILEGACELAVHRKSSSMDVQDIQTFLERQRNMWHANDVKDAALESVKSQKKNMAGDAHKQRLALIKKNLKKY